jgi:hypothetical protein
LAWCKVSSLTAAVARCLRGLEYPTTKRAIMSAIGGKVVEGWELSYFLGQALTQRRYSDLRSVILDLEDWLAKQG